MLTIQLYFHISGFSNFKHYYTQYICKYFTDHFFLVSYQQFNKTMNQFTWLLDLFLQTRMEKDEVLHFIDATSLAVCHKIRGSTQKVFKEHASFGYSTIHGQFFGFKLHLVVNQHGEIADYAISPAKKHDSKFTLKLSKSLKGRLCGDRAYLSKEHQEKLAMQGLKLITHTRSNMSYKNVFHGIEKKMLQGRWIVENVFNKLKNVFHIENNRCRSIAGFFSHCLSVLLAYTFDQKKPHLNLA